MLYSGYSTRDSLYCIKVLTVQVVVSPLDEYVADGLLHNTVVHDGDLHAREQVRDYTCAMDILLYKNLYSYNCLQ